MAGIGTIPPQKREVAGIKKHALSQERNLVGKGMKTTLFSVFFLISFISWAQAEDISLSLPYHFEQSICPVPAWKQIPVVWKGVKDKRATAEVGKQEKKGMITNTVYANPSLEKVFDEALRVLLPTCGMKFQDKETEETRNVHVEIEDFSAGVEKKLFTGKGEASSRIAIIMDINNQTTQTTEVGFTIESKKARSKNTKQLKKILDELFYETLNQIPKAKQLQGF